MKNILQLAAELNVDTSYIVPYGWDKAKIRKEYYEKIKDNKTGKLVLVTAITPTKAGEGKTTTTIGLHDGLRRIGVNSLACLREPSLGPVWGIKGGAVGALKSTIVPSDDINLHFTGDFHALTATINLMSAIIENHIWQGNELNIDPDRITWTRAVDINDRSLRELWVSADGKANSVELNRGFTGPEAFNNAVRVGAEDPSKIKTKFERCYEHKNGYTITVASELMTIFVFQNQSKNSWTA